jgi:hypothetical protein
MQHLQRRNFALTDAPGKLDGTLETQFRATHEFEPFNST